MRALAALLLSAALGLSAQGCASSDGPVVMISGRDDHGLLERPAVGLQRSPSDPTVVASAPDGTFVRVLGTDHSWSRVRTIAAPAEEGWVNDHDLRGTLELVPRHIQVRTRDARVRAGQLEVLVEPIAGGDALWVAAADLREVGAQR